jgi:multiple sugar transport system substrate-binding protein
VNQFERDLFGRSLSRRRLLQATGAAGLTGLFASVGGRASAVAPTSVVRSRLRPTSSTVTMNLLCEGGGKAELEPIVALYLEETGNEVTLVELPYAGLFNRLSSELAAGDVSFDLAALDAIWLPTFAATVEPLDELFTDEVKADLFDALVAESQIEGHHVGMPIWTNSEIVFYRTDLFENADEMSAFEAEYGYPLAAPTDWQQFQDIATFFTRPDDDLFGTDVKGAVETEWLAHVLQAGSPGVVLDDEGAIIVDNEEHLAALTFYADLNNVAGVAPPGAPQTDWAAAQNLFNQGATAMTRFWAHAFPQIPEDAPVYGQVAAAPMIGGAAGVAGIPGPWYLSVPSSGGNVDAAKEFVQFAYDHNDLSIETSLGLAARKSAFEKYADQPGYEHFGPLLETLSAPATRARPATPSWQQIVDVVLVPTLQRAVESGADYAALLDSARQDIERIVG